LRMRVWFVVVVSNSDSVCRNSRKTWWFRETMENKLRNGFVKIESVLAPLLRGRGSIVRNSKDNISVCGARTYRRAGSSEVTNTVLSLWKVYHPVHSDNESRSRAVTDSFRSSYPGVKIKRNSTNSGFDAIAWKAGFPSLRVLSSSVGFLLISDSPLSEEPESAKALIFQPDHGPQHSPLSDHDPH
jgi:hypothetical protein